MKVVEMYRRCKPDTTNGEVLQVVTFYSSFNMDEIDAMEKILKKAIGACRTYECKVEDMEDGEE